ncbi:MAG: amidohydrolase family protein, partial [Thermaerobacterales bacterium]
PEGRKFMDRLGAAIKRSSTPADLAARARQAVDLCAASGTTAMRAQCDVDSILQLDGVRALLKIRDELRHLIDLQVVVFPAGGNILDEPDLLNLVERAMELGADGVGGIPEIDPDRAADYLDLVFKVARDHGGVVDVHVDQPKDQRLFSFPIMLEKARQYGLEGKVTGAHANSLAMQPRERVVEVLKDMAVTGVHLACLPYGLIEERIQLPKSLGVNVSLINDNVRDPWQRGGSGDLIQMAMIYARTGAVRTDAELEEAFDMLTYDGARALGLADYGIRPGARADLVLFDAAAAPDVICQHVRPAMVFKNGRVTAQDGRMRPR